MNILLLTLAIAAAGYGVYLLGDFLFWRVQARVVLGIISGFQDRRSLGMRLPVVSFETPEEAKQEAKAERIDRFSYVLNRPGEGASIMIIYLPKKPARMRVYGMINVVAAGFLFTPLLLTAGIQLSSPQLLVQVAYISIFAVIAIGGWVVMKLIGRNY